MESASGRRPLLVSKTWVQAVGLVVLFGFFVLGLLAYRTYKAEPPTPARVVDPAGRTIFTSSDIRNGQKIFLSDGLMEFGSIFGHGAYLGPDFTADYLHRAALSVRQAYGGPRSDVAAQRTISDFQQNRYDSRTKTLRYSAPQAAAFQQLERYYAGYLASRRERIGLRPGAITKPEQIRQLTAYFSWSAWAASARRPGHNYSYTNNWPPEPAVDNTPIGQRDRLERAVADRAARRDRPAVRRVRALELPRLARPRASHAHVPHARRRRAHPCAARMRVVLLRDGRAVPAPDDRGRRRAALPGRCRQLLRHRHRQGVSVQPRCAPGTCSSRSSGWPRRSWRRASSSPR